MLDNFLELHSPSIKTAKDDHILWMGDFNRHHPLWEDIRNWHLFNYAAANPLIDMIAEHGMIQLLPQGLPTLQSSSTEAYFMEYVESPVVRTSVQSFPVISDETRSNPTLSRALRASDPPDITGDAPDPLAYLRKPVRPMSCPFRPTPQAALLPVFPQVRSASYTPGQGCSIHDSPIPMSWIGSTINTMSAGPSSALSTKSADRRVHPRWRKTLGYLWMMLCIAVCCGQAENPHLLVTSDYTERRGQLLHTIWPQCLIRANITAEQLETVLTTGTQVPMAHSDILLMASLWLSQFLYDTSPLNNHFPGNDQTDTALVSWLQKQGCDSLPDSLYVTASVLFGLVDSHDLMAFIDLSLREVTMQKQLRQEEDPIFFLEGG
ncbi:hypothetical protein EDB19DRAFT_1921109 [Suillus lakei]|nr:hypothetical protein EDB19DRAFT_1921109 [Suillus lakei]